MEVGFHEVEHESRMRRLKTHSHNSEQRFSAETNLIDGTPQLTNELATIIGIPFVFYSNRIIIVLAIRRCVQHELQR